MYCDKDLNERYSIMDLGLDELETIRRAIIAYRTGLIHERHRINPQEYSEPHEQYTIAARILKKIESI